MMHWYGGNGWWMGWSWVLWVLVLLALGWIIFLSLRQAGKGGQPTRSSALDILNERYAKGEIDKQEYEERKRTLLE